MTLRSVCQPAHRSRIRNPLPTLVFVTLLVLGALGAGNAVAHARTPGPACLWAGQSHPQGSDVIAGGWTFTCTTGHRGLPHWNRGGMNHRYSTVPNPGARNEPTGLFSSGAQQPGTEYQDYCVGYQLIEGTDSVYEVVADSVGSLRWKHAEPVDRWTFTEGDDIPGPTTNSMTMCYDN